MHPVSQRVIDATPRRFRRPVDVSVRTIDNAVADRLPGLAAEIAFWVLLSLPALLIASIGALGALGGRLGDGWEEQFTERVVEVAGFTLTQSTIDNAVLPLIEQILRGGGVGLVSVSFVAAVWTASRAVKVVLQTVAIVRGNGETREGWKDRLLGFGIAISAMLAGVILAPLLIAGPGFGDQLASWVGAGESTITTLWGALYWPTVLVGATGAVWALYRFGVPRSGATRELPGAILATLVWLAGSAGLRLYGAWFMTGDSVYGQLAGPIVGLLWLWLSGFAVLLGAELNASSRRRS